MPSTDPFDPNSPSAKAAAQKAKVAAAQAPKPAAPAAPAAPAKSYTPYTAPAPTTTPSGTSMPAGGWASWKDVPTGEQNTLSGWIDIWEQQTGYQVPITSAQMLGMVNAGVETMHDIGQYIANTLATPFASVLANMPWAQYGLDKDTYAATAGTFGTEYKKITGQDITKDALHQAFLSPPAAGGGIMTASQYAQQLMNDQSIQNTYGWVKYGLDYASWTQNKLSMRTGMGRDVTDAEAATVLQYNKAATGSSAGVTVKQTGQQTQQPAGVGGSVVR
jgi:hypothetical protein